MAAKPIFFVYHKSEGNGLITYMNDDREKGNFAKFLEVRYLINPIIHSDELVTKLEKPILRKSIYTNPRFSNK